MQYLILGGGPAGIAAAKTIRKAKSDAGIVIATDETEAPYLRPLLPDLILGEARDETILDPQGRDLLKKGVRLLPGRRAVRLDMGNRKVDFSDGTQEGYDILLIATGGKPEVPAALKKELPAIRVFDSRKDALGIKERASQPGPAVVYGPAPTTDQCIVSERHGRLFTGQDLLEPSKWKRNVTGYKPVFIRHPEVEIGGQTARPVHGGQHPVSTSALRNARSRNEFNASSHPVGPALSAGSGRGFGVCFGSVLLLSSL